MTCKKAVYRNKQAGSHQQLDSHTQAGNHQQARSRQRHFLSGDPQYGRLIRACVIVVVLILVIAFTGWVEHAHDQEVPEKPNDDVVLDEEYALGTLQAFEQKVEAASTDLPPSFEDEVLSLAQRADVRANKQAGIVSFTADESPGKTLKTIEKELVTQGWIAVENGSEICETFIKETGMYRWGFASCVEVGGLTCAVVQVVPTAKTAA